MRWAIDTRKMAGALALAGGVLVLGTALAQALRPETAPLPEAPPEVLPAVDLAEQGTPPVPAASPSPATSSISDEIVREAANQAPFDPERRPPTQRYRLPGERQQVVEEEPRFEMPPVPPLRVLGTIAGPGGGIAVLQEAGEQPRVVSVGQTIGEYLLVAVREEAVTVNLREWELELTLEEGNMEVVAESEGRSGRSNRRETSSQERQRLLESLARTWQERLGSGFRVQIDGGRAYIIGADGTRREVQVPGSTTGRTTPILRGTRIIPPDSPKEQSELTGTSRGGY